MKRGIALALGAAALLAGLPSAGRLSPAVRAQEPAGAAMRIALTFDDLPVHGPLPPGVSRADVARDIIAALGSHHAPPIYGFVNARGLEEAPGNAEVLRMWRAAGHLLGNHTVSHMDLNANTVDAFEQDIVANEPVLRTYMGGRDWRWLRFPYLREGDTEEKRQAIAKFLKDRGYKVAPVTLSFGDWAYNDTYARCSVAGDRAAIDWMKSSYLEQAGAAMTRARSDATLRYGRDTRHVMLLHLGAFDALMMPALLELVRGRGASLIGLEEAQRDLAAAAGVRPPPATTSMPPSAKAASAPPRDDTMTRLAALCR